MGKISMLAGAKVAGVAALAVAMAGCSQGGHASHDAATAGSSRTARLTVERRVLGQPIPSAFVGLSMEFDSVPAYAGPSAHSLNPVFQRLVQNLAPGQRPSLRIGGDTTDWVWVAVRHRRRPLGVRFTLDRRWLTTVGALAHKLDARILLGINLEENKPWLAAAEARAMTRAIGQDRIDAFEIGNEPELYGSFAWFELNGRKYYGRPHDYNFHAFQGDFSRIARSMPAGALGGPNTGSPNWFPYLHAFLRAQPRVRLASLHRYPLKKCSASAHVTIPQLLSQSSSRGLARSVARYVGVAHRRGVPLRVDEMNAVSCGGAPGVSNTFATALWSIDALFQMARVGVDGINIHTRPGMTGELFSFSRVHRAWEAVVNPEYYGLMMFAQAAPAGARLLKIAGASGGKLQSWATRAPGGQLHVVLVNNDMGAAHVVSVGIPAAKGPATLERLLARNAAAKSHVTLGGQHLWYRSGGLTGRRTDRSVSPVRGRYVVRVPAASAAMLTVSGQ